MQAQYVAAAYLLDWLIGDPEMLPHPVRLFGKCITWVDRNFRRTGSTPQYELLTGGLLAVGLPVAAYCLTVVLLKQAPRKHLFFGGGLEIMLAASCLATRNLIDEASQVIAMLEAHDIPAAQAQVARIVGRDTHRLDVSQISRAVIETLAESLADGIIAPLFYLALGGVPAALAYKAINTMDSMIGHKNDRYWYFGKMAARLDDFVNILPSRMSALLLCAATSVVPGANGKRAWESWLSDGSKHESPNSGQPESAMAGALGVRLGGANWYDGEKVENPVIGEQFDPPSISHARAAIKMTAAASILGCGVALFYLWRRR